MIQLTGETDLTPLEFSLHDDVLTLGFAQRQGARPCDPVKILGREGAALRRTGGLLHKLLREQGMPGAALRASDLVAHDFTADQVLALLSGFLLADYRPPVPEAGRPVPEAGDRPDPEDAAELTLHILDDAQPAADDSRALPAARPETLPDPLPGGVPAALPEALPALLGAVVAQSSATLLARDLAHTPSNLKNPQWFAARAVELAAAGGPNVLADPQLLSVRVLDEEELAELGFGGILAVGAGSASPPRLVVVEYRPGSGTAGNSTPHAVLVGKGITFDTGGISIKPRDAMMLMKTDMAGAAAALAATFAAAELELPVRVTAVLPLAENHFGAASYRPGDVLRMFDGSTLEVENTDAEGRVVLYDAMTWAVAEYEPDYLVDIATLTGAVTIGLGRSHAALYGTDLAVQTLERAGGRTGENVWHFPLVADYLVPHPTSVAQLQQYPKDVKGGGSITAALLLREAAKLERGHQWAHLDIAGTGRADEDGPHYIAGATGYGAALLTQWVAELAQLTS